VVNNAFGMSAFLVCSNDYYMMSTLCFPPAPALNTIPEFMDAYSEYLKIRIYFASGSVYGPQIGMKN
jgi:hypothetical protein